MSRTLVTGGTGYVGMKVVQEMQGVGRDVRVLDEKTGVFLSTFGAQGQKFSTEIESDPGAAGPNGIDRVTNIERLQFSDQAVVLGGTNNGPVGTVSLSSFAPRVPTGRVHRSWCGGL